MRKEIVLEMITWLILLFNNLTFILCTVNKLSGTALISFSTLYTLSYSCLIGTGLILKVSSCSSRTKEIEIREGESQYELFCEICQVFVKEKTKHCSRCERCVDGFDHHCKWLNLCIGESNYKLFIFLIVVLQVSCFVTMYSISFVLKNEQINRESSSFFGTVIANLVVNSVIFIVNGYLIGFHVYLKIKNISTYEFLTSRGLSGSNKIVNVEDFTDFNVLITHRNHNRPIIQNKGRQEKDEDNACNSHDNSPGK